jgi:uncharacterized membrane protein
MTEPTSRPGFIRSLPHFVALLGIAHLIAISALWELVLDPHQNNAIAWIYASLKTIPLLLMLPGVMRASVYTMQWASMFVLLYMAEGCVRGMTSTGPSQLLGWAAFTFAWATFFGLILHVRPFKKAAKAAKAANASPPANG